MSIKLINQTLVSGCPFAVNSFDNCVLDFVEAAALSGRVLRATIGCCSFDVIQVFRERIDRHVWKYFEGWAVLVRRAVRAPYKFFQGTKARKRHTLPTLTSTVSCGSTPLGSKRLLFQSFNRINYLKALRHPAASA